MGMPIDKEHFNQEDFREFATRLQQNLTAMEALLKRPGFGAGPRTLGAELELFLVDAQGRPFPFNRAVLRDAVDPRLCLELDRFNLELNLTARAFTGRPFTQLATEMQEALAETRRAAARQGGRIACIGILPTLEERHFGSSYLTDVCRYRALSNATRRLRKEPFRVAIEGEESVSLTCDDVTFEGANTSFQIHLRVTPEEFASVYNAAQIATGPALAAASNSPFLLGRLLWEETRIALFRQAVDDRPETQRYDEHDDWRPARVSFGHGWVRKSAYELFAESVQMHAPLLPVVSEEDPLEVTRAGGVPSLGELRLHHGTVWRWNRAVYDDKDGGHLRVEFRSLPAGPSVPDMTANAAFLCGLTLSLAAKSERWMGGLTFGNIRRNFYQAARYGLDAELLWPTVNPPSPHPVKARELLVDLLPLAREGLVTAGILAEEADTWLGILARRLKDGLTGSEWQRRTVARFERSSSRPKALIAMLERYVEESERNVSISEWRWEEA